ncbi:MAG: pseudouridine synthase [Clostridia bacterium]
MDNLLDGKRLNKFLGDSGYCSRRAADKLIEQGRVTIDGRAGVLGDRVQPGMDVRVDGKSLTGESEKVYLALNKPVGIVSTTDPREPLNVVDYLNYPTRVFPIGRLDKMSSGLLLLTSDGEIVNRILRAAGGHEKEYLVAVDKALTPEFLRKMAGGVEILDRVTLPCQIDALTQNSFRLVLVQGLNRQIRRMCEALGYRVRSLKRVRIMNIALGELPPGGWRLLTRDEVETILSMTSPEAQAHCAGDACEDEDSQ